jgi:hypothetical protein
MIEQTDPELNLQTRLDYREYFEIPSFLFVAISYAFWLSFADIDAVSPNLWPLVWLAITAAVLLNPFPVMSKTSRYWLIKSIARLLVPGVSRVEFTDFWMG